MTQKHKISGQCLCGAVTVQANMPEPALRACHCDMCRRHTSSMFMSLRLDQDTVEVQGPFKTYRSSEWAERGFCGECGSTLWYSTVHDGVRNLSAGLFDDLDGVEMKIEFFTDAAPKGYALAGDHRKMTTAETIAMFAPDEGDG